MNQVIIAGFTRTCGDTYPASATQAPMRLRQHHDSAIRSSQEGWFWFSTIVLCDPTLARATRHVRLG
jgi:hypothetical protein